MGRFGPVGKFTFDDLYVLFITILSVINFGYEMLFAKEYQKLSGRNF